MNLEKEKKRGFLYHINPVTKIIMAIAFSAIVIILPGWPIKYIMFLLLAAVVAAGGDFIHFVKTVVKTMLFLFIFIMIIQGFFGPGQTVLFEIGRFRFKREGMEIALNLFGILLSVASSFAVFFQTSDMHDFIIALEGKGIPPKASYIVLSTLQMVPEMKRRSGVIMSAQQARGIETEGSLPVRIKAFLPMMAPLVLSSFTGIEERALTLEARAFSAPTNKTNIRTVKETKTDRILIHLSWIVVVLVIIGRIVWL